MARDRSCLDGDIAAFIVRAQLHDGVCPSYREIARQFGITADDVTCALIRLQERGHVRLLPYKIAPTAGKRRHKVRAIEVVSVPEPMVDKLLRVFEQIDAMRAESKDDE